MKSVKKDDLLNFIKRAYFTKVMKKLKPGDESKMQSAIKEGKLIFNVNSVSVEIEDSSGYISNNETFALWKFCEYVSDTTLGNIKLADVEYCILEKYVRICFANEYEVIE